MPWKVNSVVDERIRVVELVRSGISVSEVARSAGVSRKSVYKWLERADEAGRAGLEDRSRARLTQTHATDEETCRLLIRLRRRTGFGARLLIDQAGRAHPDLSFPAKSTVHDILRRAGLIEPKRRTRRDAELRGPTGPYRPGKRPNEQWTTDFKGHFRLGDRTMCHPLTVQDDAPRFLLCAKALRSTGAEDVIAAFRGLFRRFGLPERIHSDNGAPFASPGLFRLTRLNVDWLRQGITVCRSRPGRPQDNPRHERMHRTLKDRTARPPSATLAAQARRLTKWVEWMNEGRGHQSLSMCEPASRYEPSVREWQPRPAAPEYPGHWEVRRVRSTGEIQIGGGKVFLSHALTGDLVGLEEVEEDVWRAAYRSLVLCFVDCRKGEPRPLATFGGGHEELGLM